MQNPTIYMAMSAYKNVEVYGVGVRYFSVNKFLIPEPHENLHFPSTNLLYKQAQRRFSVGILLGRSPQDKFRTGKYTRDHKLPWIGPDRVIDRSLRDQVTQRVRRSRFQIHQEYFPNAVSERTFDFWDAHPTKVTLAQVQVHQIGQTSQRWVDFPGR